jgi:hypothetical protein
MSRMIVFGLMMFSVFGLALCDDNNDNANLLKTAGNINANANALVNGANALNGINANEANAVNGANSTGANALHPGGISNPGNTADDANLDPLR